MKYSIAFTLLITSAIHAMNDSSITIQPIRTEQELQELVEGTNKMFNQVYQETPLTVEGQKDYSTNFRSERLKQLLLIPAEQRNNIFVLQNGERIGGAATHKDTNDSSRVILDRADLGTTEATKKIVRPTIIKFILQTYPECTTLWTATPRQNEGSAALAQPAGFEKSDYMDEFHDAQFCQGWELKLPRK